MKPLIPAACLLFLVGCTESNPERSSSPDNIDGTKYLLSAEPKNAHEVIQVRKDAKDGDDVVIVGRIGGSKNPWIKGRAAFTIVDGSLKACSDIEGDNCKFPWDYCCETSKLPTSTAFIEVVDDAGKLIKADARELLKVKELSTVVVKGKAKRDKDGNLTVLASGVYIRK